MELEGRGSLAEEAFREALGAAKESNMKENKKKEFAAEMEKMIKEAQDKQKDEKSQLNHFVILLVVAPRYADERFRLPGVNTILINNILYRQNHLFLSRKKTTLIKFPLCSSRPLPSPPGPLPPVRPLPLLRPLPPPALPPAVLLSGHRVRRPSGQARRRHGGHRRRTGHRH